MEKPTVREIPYNLHYYDQEVVTDVVENGFAETINPVSGHTARDNGTLKFLITGTDYFVDLSKTYLILRCKLQCIDKEGADKSGLTNIGTTSLSVVNNTAHSIFKSVKVRLANQNITVGDTDYAYKAYIQNLFNTSAEAQNTYFKMCGWEKDASNAMDNISMTASSGANTGLYNRRRLFTDEGQIEFVMKIHSAIFFHKKAILPYIDIEIELMRQPVVEFFMTHAADYKCNLLIEDAFLQVQKYKCNPAYVAGIEAMLRDKNEPVIFKLNDSIVNTYTLNSGIQNYHNDTLFLGRIPKRIIIGFVNSTAYNGNRSYNPFNFQNCNISVIRLLKNGLEYPQPALNIDFTTHKYRQAYHALMASVQSDYSRDVLNITPAEFIKGYTLFSWDMSPDQQGSIDLNNAAHKPSAIKLEIKFASALANTMQMIVYFEVDTQIAIDFKRNILVNQV